MPSGPTAPAGDAVGTVPGAARGRPGVVASDRPGAAAGRVGAATTAAGCALVLLVGGCTLAPPVDPPTGTVPAPTPHASGSTSTGPSPHPGTTPAPVPSGPDTLAVTGVEERATGLDAPWGLAFLPDATAVVTLRDEARLVLVPDGGTVIAVTGEGADTLAGLVAPRGEGGLLGVAVLGPAHGAGTVADTSDEPVDLALYVTTAADNRVVAATLDGDRLGPLRPLLTGIPHAGNHNGGRLAVGPDGYLYVTTGDAGRREAAQDPDDLGGKILRITVDGDPAPGNPVPGSPVWSLGHRNVQGLDWSSDGRMFASEFGQSTWDELNLVVPGGNYGWPVVEGDGGAEQGFVEPLATWPTADASPSGLAVTDEGVYLAALRGERLWRVPLRPPGDRPLPGAGIGTPHALLTDRGRLRAVVHGPDGALWVLTNTTDGRGDPRPGDDRLLRLIVG